MSDDLRDDLTAIDGVGDATADAILDVLADHDTGESDPLLDKARAAARQGDERKAAIFLRRSERGEDDALFYWTGASPGDDRQTEACEWLIRQTNPFEGGQPRPMDELRSMLNEAWTHDDDMDTNMARPESWVVHINERSTFSKAPPNWEQL